MKQPSSIKVKQGCLLCHVLFNLLLRTLLQFVKVNFGEGENSNMTLVTLSELCLTQYEGI